MKKSIEDSTEDKIKEAARTLFLKNGLKGTTIREVAECAGANVALVNYYFRSKNKLFISIFSEKFITFSESGYHILHDTSKPISERLIAFLDHYIDLFLADPNLPIFILSELHYNTDLLEVMAALKKDSIEKNKDKLQLLLDEETEKGNINQISIRNLEMTLTSMLIFPFITRNMLHATGEFESESFEDFIDNWKSHVKRVMISFMIPK